MATIDVTLPKLDPIKGQKSIPLEEFFTSGHRTCQGCESALVMKMMAKAAGPRTIVLGKHRLHVRREHDLLQHLLGKSPGCTRNWAAADQPLWARPRL